MRILHLTAVLIGGLWLVAGSTCGAAAASDVANGLTPQTLRCEYLSNPIGVDVLKPRLSWTMQSDQRGARQSAYQIVVASDRKALEGGTADLWDSGKVSSSEQNQIEYAGKPLASRQGCVWRVRVWDQNDQPGPWSEPASWEVGLRDKSDWQAKWIGDGPGPKADVNIVDAQYEAVKDVTSTLRQKVEDGRLAMKVDSATLGSDSSLDKHKQLVVKYSVNGGPTTQETFSEKSGFWIPPRSPQVLRRSFQVDRPIVRARLYVTALGLYALSINGQRVGDHLFAPDWTDYNKRVRYQAYDVTPLVKTGANAIGGTIANGWYSGKIGNGGFQFWGTRPWLLAQLELTHEDGSVERICTDEQWRSHPGPIISADIMDGESFDARAELDGSDPNLTDDGKWEPVEIKTEGLPPEIDPQVSPPVRELLTLKAKSVKESAPGHWVFDLGQNMVGVPRLKLNAPAGTTITVRVAEMLNPDGTIYTANYRRAASTDTYICRGGGETWQPQFTFHGFRYLELTGLPDRPDLDAVAGVVLGSDTPSTGTFNCSDPDINQLWSNIRWGQRGNFLSVPTDCPQRDERLGWMGDAEVFVGTAVYNADVSAFFSKWLVDVDDEQTADGQYTNTSPEPNLSEHGTPAWADAGVICPWVIYRTYGDKRELQQHLPHMMRWVDWCKEHSDGLIRDRDRGNDFGDWLSINADTSKELLGTAYFAHSADLVARSAKAVGDDANAAKYADLFEQIKAAFDKKYVAPDGSIANGTQTTYALALAFGLLPEDQRPPAAARLAHDIESKGNHLSSGFLGVSFLLPTLTRYGQTDVAFRLLLQDTFPSWLFPIRHGATTIWERWDGWTPEKGFQSPSMNSFNHYSLGSCGQWMYESLAGIAQGGGEPGFAHLLIRPRIGNGSITSVAATYDSIRGAIRSAWAIKGDRLTLDVTVPANVTASVWVPTSDPKSVMESGKPIDKANGVRANGVDATAARFEIGSGTYHFAASLSRSNGNGS